MWDDAMLEVSDCKCLPNFTKIPKRRAAPCDERCVTSLQNERCLLYFMDGSTSCAKMWAIMPVFFLAFHLNMAWVGWSLESWHTVFSTQRRRCDDVRWSRSYGTIQHLTNVNVLKAGFKCLGPNFINWACIPKPSDPVTSFIMVVVLWLMPLSWIRITLKCEYSH